MQKYNIGIKIRRLRQSKHLSQERFAFRIGISGKTISSYETGRSIPSLRVLEKIERTYTTQILVLPSDRKSFISARLHSLEVDLSEIRELLQTDLSF